VLILDEPTASISDREAQLLFDIIRRLRARGLSVIYISHRLEEVFEIADRVTVLRDGRAVGSHAVGDVTLNQVIRLMVGRELSDLFRKEEVPIGQPVLEVKHLSVRGVLHDISFTLHRGEILGLAGLVGAGRTELAMALFGADRRDAGEVLLDGKPMDARSPGEAIAHGLGLAPEDRKQHGLVMGMSVAHNVTLANLFRRHRLGFINLGRERRTAEDYVRRLGIRTPDVQRDVKFLSGGNQQRVVIAKWLETRPRVLILDEPTQGVDVGAKAEIHALMVDLARSGVGILMISSDLPEVLQMSDRLLVMHQGRVTGCLSRAEATQEQVMRYATDTVLQTAEPVPQSPAEAESAL
jgi:ABC-type sugar transport system ATPase subunit